MAFCCLYDAHSIARSFLSDFASFCTSCPVLFQLPRHPPFHQKPKGRGNVISFGLVDLRWQFFEWIRSQSFNVEKDLLGHHAPLQGMGTVASWQHVPPAHPVPRGRRYQHAVRERRRRKRSASFSS